MLSNSPKHDVIAVTITKNLVINAVKTCFTSLLILNKIEFRKLTFLQFKLYYFVYYFDIDKNKNEIKMYNIKYLCIRAIILISYFSDIYTNR